MADILPGNGTRAVVVSQDNDLFDTLDQMEEVEIVGFLDASPDASDARYKLLGTDEAWSRLRSEDPGLRAILAVDPPALRFRLAGFYGVESLLSLIAPDAKISVTARLGNGCVVQQGVTVGRNVIVGEGCKLNCDSFVHHDSTVGDYCTLAPAARLLGHVAIGACSYIGSGAIVLPRIHVGTGVTIGAGAVVTRDVPDGVTAKGVPAKW